MQASQVSFSAFASALLASAQTEFDFSDCTPLVHQAPAAVVAHPEGAGVGECPPLSDVFHARPDPAGALRPDFIDGLSVVRGVPACASFGAGLDAPDYLPSGSHRSYVCGSGHSWAWSVLDGYGSSRLRFF